MKMKFWHKCLTVATNIIFYVGLILSFSVVCIGVLISMFGDLFIRLAMINPDFEDLVNMLKEKIEKDDEDNV
jgi:hypothetical protein